MSVYAAHPAVGQSESLTSTLLPLLFISLLLSAVGFALVFDIGRLASRSYKENTGFSSWSKRHEAFISRLPNPFKVVGWIFFSTGLGLLLLIIIGAIVKYS
jgi:hypothetical protein